jgi:7-cyano-7-deazaguanine synthase
MIQMQKRALLVFSGGQDSTTCLYWALKQGYEVFALTINYGQRHAREIEAAKTIAKMAEVYHDVINVPNVLVGSSPLVSHSTLEQYADHSSLPGGLEKTFVPMRNQFFLTIAANRAHSLGCDVIITGVCEEDYGGYPDCRRVFIDALEKTCNLGTFNEETGYPDGIQILTPLMHLTKKQTVEMAEELEGCYASLAFSHTAYDGQYPPIGKDHATLLRAKGFEEALVPDPLVLRAVKEGLMPMPDSENYAPELVAAFSASMV